jgi:TRAP-type C4-dicarboxylate transport system substrate-binding protein
MKLAGLGAALMAAAFASVAHPASAQETTLIFTTLTAANGPLAAQMLIPWAERINERGKGIVHIDVRNGLTLANFTNFYSRVMDDVVQISFGTHSNVGGKFPRTNVAALPFESDKADTTSVALWRLYKSGVLDAEYDEVVPLFFVGFPQSGLHFAKPPHSADNLNGLKVLAIGRIPADAISQLGGIPLSIPISGAYEALQRGTVDATSQGWTSFPSFKLAEVSSYHIDTPFGSNTAMVFMSKKKFASLSPAARKVLEDTSGEAQSRIAGEFWDRISEEWRDKVKAMPDHQVVTLSPAQEASWRERLKPVTDHWVKNTPDGEKVLAQFRADLKAVGPTSRR